VDHIIREVTDWAPSQQAGWPSLEWVREIPHSLLEGMDLSPCPQGYEILNIMDLFMATQQPLRQQY
jgi:hypothetical protein